MKIAVIGGGIAGLVAAWNLGKHHRVTVLERHAEPGLGTHGVDLSGDLGEGRVDVPVRTFHEGYYPQLTRLYRQLGVDTEPVDFATTYSTLQGDDVYFRYHNLRLGSLSLPMVRSPWRKTVRRILGDLWRLHRHAKAKPSEQLADQSLGEFLRAEGYSREFCDLFLLPLFAVVCTCSYDNVRSFPADTMLEYLRSGIFSRAVRRPVRGTSDVVARLLEPVETVRCSVRVTAVERSPSSVTLSFEDGEDEAFDHVVVATQANHVSSFLAPTAAEEAMLGCFNYDTVRVVTHTDTSLLPADRSAWAPINAAVSAQHDRPMATIWIAAAQPSLGLSREVFQTVHPLVEPQSDKVLGSTDFARPIVDSQTVEGYRQLGELHAEPGRRLWFCGSYASRGIPLLESATASAFQVTDRLLALGTD